MLNANRQIVLVAKMGVNRGCRLTVNFRTDVFKFLFEGKGREYSYGRGRMYSQDDFDEQYFDKDWHRAHDRLGDGCKVEFPLHMASKVKWSPTVYVRDERGAVLPKKKKCDELVTVWIVKQRC